MGEEKLTPAERVRLWRIAHKDDPAYRERKRKERRRYLEKLRQDPEKYQKYLEQERLRAKRKRVRRRQERTDLNKICPICGEAFRASGSNQKICPKEACKKKNKSIQTYATFKKKRALTYHGCFKNCVICGRKFRAKGRAICCSRECSRKRKNEMASAGIRRKFYERWQTGLKAIESYNGGQRMSIKPELQRCVADYLRKYLVEYGKWEDIPEKERAAPGVDHFWKIGLAEFQIEDMADDIIEEIKRTLSKHIFTSVFGEEEL